jgi:hypothetical protein
MVSKARPKIARTGSMVKEKTAMIIAPTYPIAVAVVLFIIKSPVVKP